MRASIRDRSDAAVTVVVLGRVVLGDLAVALAAPAVGPAALAPMGSAWFHCAATAQPGVKSGTQDDEPERNRV
jgi:hypothetical protein